MEYIAHKRFKEIAACEQFMNIPYGTKLETIRDFIVTSRGQVICFTTSENAHKHFARNDDGRGLERGAITYAIAYGKCKPTNTKDKQNYRFSDEKIKILEKNWRHFLRDDVDVILFNHDFFNAEIEDLREMAKQLNVKVKEVY